MALEHLRLSEIAFPGRAGEHQRAGATASVVRELGDNYRTYNRFLADRLATEIAELGGGLPDPARFDTVESYAKAWGRLELIVYLEVSLRRCRAFRRGEGRLDSAPDATVPLFDDAYRLVGVE
jgi:hypothetical protein